MGTGKIKDKRRFGGGDFGVVAHRTLNWRVKHNYKVSHKKTSNLVKALKFNQS